MRLTAHITYEGGALLLPAQDPYDRQIAFEEAECCARRHGMVRVQFGSTPMRIRRVHDGVDVCDTCRQPIATLCFLLDGLRACPRCARQRMHCDVSPQVKPDRRPIRSASIWSFRARTAGGARDR